jgi:hypothetical protein
MMELASDVGPVPLQIGAVLVVGSGAHLAASGPGPVNASSRPGASTLHVPADVQGMEWPDPPIPEVLNSHMSSLGLAESGERQRAA